MSQRRHWTDQERARILAIAIGVALLLFLYGLGALGYYVRQHYMPEQVSGLVLPEPAIGASPLGPAGSAQMLVMDRF